MTLTLEEIVIEMRELSERLRGLTEALALVELQTTAAACHRDQLRQSARQFLRQPLTNEERCRMRSETGIICPEGCTRKAALLMLFAEDQSGNE